ncbi:hypothetical protein [Paenarthrobacter ureafaciens]|uniref:hypothetical protein n=1 Tax=Paenarthrobacter ureafaciens TaxID=37931 RepID=UPI001D171D55|nr:hypothetical protein [Paenarthrobacter ureafaciens]GLU61517.1 hypothetical protein Pure01_40300 [Paenarthrobacter ureafaciens]GLU65790.1 hypothetical protein Pure02_40400 [Paenarthrobacter ureafaciens]GLU70133.1 hypothetical protein Pure03_41090 [Paenarthrobacter ureafaciens]GLU74349.1 hypothetical protein Pure04_40640 [Paenarthrobacter ureafaciens]GLU78619.1 hypothetical protein Pure05_40590 [Paenarthrobacter ureafaciens]
MAVSQAGRRWTGAIAWVLLVLASLILIGYGIIRAEWHIELPNPAGQEETWIGSRYIFAGCGVSLTAVAWSHLCGNPAWVRVCVGLPGILVGWATLDDPYNLLRHLAAVVSFPLALAGIAGVIWAGGHRQRG